MNMWERHPPYWLVKRYEEKLKDSEKRAKLIRQALIKSKPITLEEPDKPPKRIASA